MPVYDLDNRADRLAFILSQRDIKQAAAYIARRCGNEALEQLREDYKDARKGEAA